MLKFLFPFFILFSAEYVFSQYNKNYYPLKVTDTIPADLQKVMKDRLESDIASAKASIPKKEVYKYKCGLYEERTKTVMNLINKDYFMIDSVFTPYLQRIADNIYTANPHLKKDTRIFAYRSAVPNAVCFGEGTLAINLGLLNRMENESQIAFIIGHELAHHHQRHTEKHIDKLTHLNFDEELAKEIKQISKEEYNQYSKLKELLRELTFDVTKHSRTNENEADSIGLSFILKTSYDPWQAIRAMEILDSCDVPLVQSNLILKKYFDFEKYPFKDDWLNYDTSEFYYAKDEYADSDTASTHPDCKKRIVSMKRQLNEASQTSSAKIEDPVFNDLKIKSEFETIESLFHFGDLGRALYLSLTLLEKYPENAYLHAMVGKCLCFIYRYQKNKEFGKVVSLTDNRFSESYNRFLSFLHNLRLIEIATISYNYVESHSEKYSEDEEFLYTMIVNSNLPVAKPGKENLIKTYKEKFPKGKYIDRLENF